MPIYRHFIFVCMELYVRLLPEGYLRVRSIREPHRKEKLSAKQTDEV